MHSRIDADPRFHADQVAKAMAQLVRRNEIDRKHSEWMKTRPGAQLYSAMCCGFHNNPFHQVEGPLAGEAELRHMAQLSDEIGGDL